MNRIFISAIFITLVINCATPSHEIKLIMPTSFDKQIQICENHELYLIYYHSGDCSLCYGILSHALKVLPDIQLVSISSSIDTLMVDYYMQNINYTGMSLLDADSLFFRFNQKVLQNGSLMLIDRGYNVIAKSFDLKENFILEINNYIENIRKIK